MRGFMNPFRYINEMMRPLEGDIAEQKRRTKQLSIWEGSMWSLMWGLAESYIVPFALFIGAGNAMAAFLGTGTGPILITATAQLVGAKLLDQYGRRKSFMIFGTAVQGLALIPLFLLPMLLPGGGMTALVACAVVYYISFGIAVPPWMSLMGDVVEPEERGRYFSNRTRITMYSMIVAFLLAGIITSAWKGIGHTATGFGFIFGIAALARLTCILFVQRHYEAPMEKPTKDSALSFWAFIRNKKNANYARFTLSVALMNGTVNICSPFFAVYMLRDLGWSYLLFTLNMMTFLLSQTLFVRWWGNISDRHGNRAVLVATGSLLPLLPLLWIYSTSYGALLFAQFVSGATWSGFNLAASNFIYDSVPQAGRARAMSYYSVVNGTMSVIGGVLVGAWLADHIPTQFQLGMVNLNLASALPVVFVISSVARGIVAAIMLPMFNEVRDVEPISTPQILWRLGIGQPLFGQVGEFMPRLRNLLPPKK